MARVEVWLNATLSSGWVRALISRLVMGPLFGLAAAMTAQGQELLPAPPDLEVANTADQAPFATPNLSAAAPPPEFAPPSSKLGLEFSRLVGHGVLKPAGKSAAPGDACERLSQAQAYYDCGSFDRALELFQMEIVDDFTSLAAHLGRARVMMVQNRYANALPDLDYVIGRDGNLVDALRMRACARMYLEMAGANATFGAALLDVARALELEPEDAGARAVRGVVALWKQDVDRAIADLSCAIERRTDNLSSSRWVNANYYRAFALMSKGEYRLAVDDFNQAAQSYDPARLPVSILMNRGLCYAYSGDRDRSIADFTDVLRQCPKDHQIYGFRAKSYLEKGDIKLALADHDQIVRLCPENPEVYVERSLVLWKNSDNTRALADVDRVVQLNPHESGVYFFRAVMSVLIESDWNRALADMDRAITLEPRASFYYAFRSYVRAKK
jgi:tetratricopeptide (TPR) repeat protein